jgi:hypothetical protein
MAAVHGNNPAVWVELDVLVAWAEPEELAGSVE